MRKKTPFSMALLLVVAAAMLIYSSAFAATPMNAKDGIGVFNGKWESMRESGGAMTLQHLHIQCNPNMNTCRIRVLIERSGTCSGLYGDPTGLGWKYNGPVLVAGLTITAANEVDLYCLSKPPSYLNHATAWFTYNEADDTLTDFGATWHRR